MLPWHVDQIWSLLKVILLETLQLELELQILTLDADVLEKTLSKVAAVSSVFCFRFCHWSSCFASQCDTQCISQNNMLVWLLPNRLCPVWHHGVTKSSRFTGCLVVINLMFMCSSAGCGVWPSVFNSFTLVPFSWLIMTWRFSYFSQLAFKEAQLCPAFTLTLKQKKAYYMHWGHMFCVCICPVFWLSGYPRCL